MLPLTDFQKWLWQVTRVAPLTTAYTIPVLLRFHGGLAVPLLAEALQRLTNRHDSLRTTFACDDDGNPVQRIAPALPIPLLVLDVDDAAPAIRQLLARPMDLYEGPLIRAALLRCGDAEHVLTLEIHHLIFDGWSQGVFLEELAQVYSALLYGEPDPLPHCAPQLPALSEAWQHMSAEREHQMAYWSHNLAGLKPFLPFPHRPRPSVRTFDGDSVAVTLDPAACTALRACSQRYSVSPAITLAAVYLVLLAEISGQHDIAVAFQAARRSGSEAAQTIGYLVNLLLLRVDQSTARTFADVLLMARNKTLGALANADVPYVHLAQEWDPQPGLGRLPLTEASFNALPAGTGLPQWPGLEAGTVWLDRSPTSRFDLELFVRFGPSDAGGVFSYRVDVIDRQTAEQIAARFHELATKLLSNPDSPLGDG